MRKRLKSLLPAVLIGLPLILYAPFLFGGQVLYWGVYLLQFYPWRQLAAEQIRAGHWPLWNPTLGAGTPLAANLQTGAFYPLNVLFLLMPVERALSWELALHVALAGLFAYYLGRTLGLGWFGALVTGLAYGLGGYVIAHWVFPTMVCAAAWLPLLLALTEKLVCGPARTLAANRLALTALLALAIALQLLAGHAQTSFYSLLITAAFALWRSSQQRAVGEPTHGNGATDGRRCAGHRVATTPQRILSLAFQTLRNTWTLALALVWGLAVAAIQLVPTAELAAHSQRAGTLSDLRFAYELSFWPWRLITLLAPDFFGHPARGDYWAYGTYWEEAAFVGVLPLLLATLALAWWWRTRPRADPAQIMAPQTRPAALVPFWGLLGLLSILLALGNHTPLYPLLFRYVPGFGLFQAPARLMIGYGLAIAVLAGTGATWVKDLRITPRLRTVLNVAILIGLGMATAGAVARLALPAIPASFGDSIIRLGLTLAAAAGLLLARRSRLRWGQWQALAVAIIAADLLAFGWGLAPGTSPAVYRTPVATAQFLQSQPPGRVAVAYPYAQEVYDRFVSLRSFGSDDPATLQGLRESLIPNLNAAVDLFGVGNYDPLTVGVYRDLWDVIAANRDGPPAAMVEGKSRQALNLFGARYLISADELPLPSTYSTGPRIYLNEAALPAAFVAPQARIIEDKEARLAALLDPAFDPRAEVLLSSPPSRPLPQGGTDYSQASQPDPTVWRETHGRVAIKVNMLQPGYLVLTDTYYPGWQATVDEQPVQILAADHAFRAVTLGPGKHMVIFEYAPLSFRIGVWISLAAALLLVISLVTGGCRARALSCARRQTGL